MANAWKILNTPIPYKNELVLEIPAREIYLDVPISEAYSEKLQHFVYQLTNDMVSHVGERKVNMATIYCTINREATRDYFRVVLGYEQHIGGNG